MNNYELSLAMNFKIPDKQKTKALSNIKNYISENATISNTYDYGIRKLPRKLKNHSKAYYYMICFECTENMIKNLKELCYSTEEILLYRIMDVTIPL